MSVYGAVRFQSIHGISTAPIASMRGQAPTSSQTVNESSKMTWVERVSEGKRAWSRRSTRSPRRPSRAASVAPATRAPTMTTSYRSRRGTVPEELDGDEAQTRVAAVVEVVDQALARRDV